jgi:hypothetical protein
MHADLCESLGFQYEVCADDSSLGVLDTPFRFEDGDPVPVYVETLGSTIRFFDDGDILMRIMGWGIPVDEAGGLEFLESLICPCGAALNEAGEIEVRVSQNSIAVGFAAYLSAILAIAHWEKTPGAIAKACRLDNKSPDAADA